MGSASFRFVYFLDWVTCLLEKGSFLNYENEKISSPQTALYDIHDMIYMSREELIIFKYNYLGFFFLRVL